MSGYSAHIIPNFPDKKFVFPWDVAFLLSPALEGMSMVVYLIWNPPAVTEASVRNFRVMTLPGPRETQTEVMGLGWHKNGVFQIDFWGFKFFSDIFFGSFLLSF